MITSRTVVLVAALAGLVAGTASADVFNMGGTYNPIAGTWTGSASLETVTVGNSGNPADTRGMSDFTTGYGSVGYNYQMGKFDVTAGQYCAFLNAVAKTDPYGLYNASMTTNTSYGCQIQQSGTSGNYTYSVDSGMANRPVNYVSWGDAARFCNWLANGQPTTGTEDASTTEDGSYYLNGATNNDVLRGVKRKASATWVIPSENEWYKAAYYNPATGMYYLYPTGSDSINTGMGNYQGAVGHGTDVGAYTYPSPYGTYDQGGNVWQWNEAVLYGSYRGLRGGSFSSSDFYLQSWCRNNFGASGAHSYDIGFRVSEVPEPATMLLTFVGAGLFLRRRRRSF